MYVCMYKYTYIYIHLQGGHAVGCDRTKTRMHTHARTQDGWTALHHAAENGHAGVAEALLRAGCNKDMQEQV